MIRRKNIFIIGDFGKDLDDELTLLFYSTFKEKFNLLGVVANLYPSDIRADIAISTFNELNITDIPVAVGNKVKDIKFNEYEIEIPYLKKHNVQLKSEDLLLETFKNNDKINMVLQSGMTDFTNFYKKHKELVISKLESVTIMGGIQIDENGQPVLNKNGNVIPDTANNNYFDIEVSDFIYEELQNIGIKLNISTRTMIYSTPMPSSFYKNISFSNIGKCFYNRQKKALIKLYEDCQLQGTERILPERCNLEWFLNTFTDSKEFNGNTDDIFEICTKINIYDPLNLLILEDDFNKEYFKSFDFKNVSIYGLNNEENGLQIDNIQNMKVYLENKIIENLRQI